MRGNITKRGDGRDRISAFRYSRNDDLLRAKSPAERVRSAIGAVIMWDDKHPIWQILDARGYKKPLPTGAENAKEEE